MQQVLDMATGSFFKKNPHALLEAWQTSTEEIACPDRCLDAVMGFEADLA